MPSPAPANWRREIQGAEIVLTFAARREKGYFLGLAVGVGSLLLLGYGLWIFVHGWVFNHEEVLPGGVILFVILLLALLFPLYIFDRLLFAESYYRMTPDTLVAGKKSFFGAKSIQIARSQALYVDKVRTPPQRRGEDDTWRTLLFHGEKKHPKSFSFEGYSREECDWLAPQISAWGAIPCQSESTVDDVPA